MSGLAMRHMSAGGIANVGHAVARSGTPDGLQPTGDEAYIAQAAMGAFQLGKAVKGLLARSARKLQSKVDDFVAKLPRKTTPTRTAANQYEIKHTGPYNYTISGGGESFAIDGYRGATILEAKFAGNVKGSPYIPGSSCPPDVREAILDQARDGLKRLRTIIESGQTPFTSVEIITNTPEAKKLFETMLKEERVRGIVRLAQ